METQIRKENFPDHVKASFGNHPEYTKILYMNFQTYKNIWQQMMIKPQQNLCAIIREESGQITNRTCRMLPMPVN